MVAKSLSCDDEVMKDDQDKTATAFDDMTAEKDDKIVGNGDEPDSIDKDESEDR